MENLAVRTEMTGFETLKFIVRCQRRQKMLPEHPLHEYQHAAFGAARHFCVAENALNHLDEMEWQPFAEIEIHPIDARIEFRQRIRIRILKNESQE